MAPCGHRLKSGHYCTCPKRRIDFHSVKSNKLILRCSWCGCRCGHPSETEIKRLRAGQTLFTYLHLAPDPEQTKGLLDARVIAIAYETVTDARGGLPLLAPMSEVAGRMSIQAGARCLEMEAGGRGQLLGGVPGVPAARVVVRPASP